MASEYLISKDPMKRATGGTAATNKDKSQTASVNAAVSWLPRADAS